MAAMVAISCGGAPNTAGNPICNEDDDCESLHCCQQICIPTGSTCVDQADVASQDAEEVREIDQTDMAPSADDADEVRAETSDTASDDRCVLGLSILNQCRL